MNSKPAGAAVSPALDEIVGKNVEAISRIEQAAHANRTNADIVSDLIAGFCGSTLFVYVHCLLFGGWLLWNGLPMVPKGLRFDQPPFNVLTLVVSLEAIFLSSFILISQNRQQRTADHRNHLDLQINLLAEQENSQMLAMLKKIMDHFGMAGDTSKSEVLQQPTDPEKLAEHIQQSLETGEKGQEPES
jgi:uncharacterized membrane protein